MHLTAGKCSGSLIPLFPNSACLQRFDPTTVRPLRLSVPADSRCFLFGGCASAFVSRRIEPGKPQQNGRQERFHRTLKAETAKPPRATLSAQQHAFDLFRRQYNDERPHEALGQRPPSSAFALSARRYPRPLMRFQIDAPWNQPARIDRDGFIRWGGKPLFISTALAHEDVELRYEPTLEQWHLLFGPLSIGWIRETPTLSFAPTKGRMVDQVEREISERVSAMSSD
jgi:hypothetical protein